jgi:hypothetical protein
MEFAYNQNVHLTIDYLSFKIIYGFNSLTLLDLILLPIEERPSVDDSKKT